MKTRHRQIYINAFKYWLGEIRFFVSLARENSGAVRAAQLERARRAAREIRPLWHGFKNNIE